MYFSTIVDPLSALLIIRSLSHMSYRSAFCSPRESLVGMLSVRGFEKFQSSLLLKFWSRKECPLSSIFRDPFKREFFYHQFINIPTSESNLNNSKWEESLAVLKPLLNKRI